MTASNRVWIHQMAAAVKKGQDLEIFLGFIGKTNINIVIVDAQRSEGV